MTTPTQATAALEFLEEWTIGLDFTRPGAALVIRILLRTHTGVDTHLCFGADGLRPCEVVRAAAKAIGWQP